MCPQLSPTGETEFTRQHKLNLLQPYGMRICEIGFDALKSGAVSRLERFEKGLCLLADRFETSVGWKITRDHEYLLSFTSGIRAHRQKEGEKIIEVDRWALPFPRIGCALRTSNPLAWLRSLVQLCYRSG